MEEEKEEVEQSASGVSLILSINRVETIAKEASDGQAFDKEALAILTKATELFLATLGSHVKAETSAWAYDEVATAVHEWEPSRDMLGESNIVPLKVKVSDLISKGII